MLYENTTSGAYIFHPTSAATAVPMVDVQVLNGPVMGVVLQRFANGDDFQTLKMLIH